MAKRAQDHIPLYNLKRVGNNNSKANVKLILLANISLMSRPGQIINMIVYEKSLLKIGKTLKKQILFVLLRNTQ